MKSWGFKAEKKTNKNYFLKGILMVLILVPFLSFFSFVDKIVYADKINFVNNILSWDLQFFYKKSFPSYIWKLIINYKQWKNILKKDKTSIFILLENINLVSSVFNINHKNLNFLAQIIKKFPKDTFSLLWENWKKTYLVILENTSEERPDWWFFWSFAKISLSGWHIQNFKIYDSYYLLRKYCNVHTKKLPKKDWFKKCNKSWLNIINNIKPFNNLFWKTTFITSNIFWFTDLNAVNIIKHYNKVFKDKIDWVIFLKSDILKYLVKNWNNMRRELEYLNWKSLDSKIKIKNNTNYSWDKLNLYWLKWKKRLYLLYMKKILKNKNLLAKNLINNFDKIIKEWLIRLYFTNVSEWFKKFLNYNNLSFNKNNKYSYLFFYNMWFNKNSKFIDHLIKIDKKILLNTLKFKLSKWYHKIYIKNILRINPFYKEFLDKKRVPKKSYLRSNNVKYYNILVLQKNCYTINNKNNFYEIICK